MTTSHEPTIIRLRSPADIIAAVPYALGFHPTQSLVVMCMRGPRRRQGLTIRVDLPEPDQVQALVDDLAARADRDGAAAVAVVCYTDERDGGAALPYAVLIETLITALDRRGVGCLELLLVREGRWYSYACTGDCCPRDGTPITKTPSSEILALEARAVLEGQAVLASRDELAASIRAPGAVREVVLRSAYQRVGETFFDDVVAHGADAMLRRTLELAHAAYERFVHGDRELADDHAVRILVGLEDKFARDALLTWALDGNAEELIAFLSTLARCALDENAAPICSALACVAYQAGNGALANIAVERALRSEPDYELARLIDTSLLAHIEPAEIRSMAERTRAYLCELGVGIESRPEAA